MKIPQLEETDIPIIFAALAAMTEDVHAPQDLLTEEQWERANELFVKFHDAEQIRRDEGRTTQHDSGVNWDRGILGH
jgi:hypothetical protein